MAAGDEGLVLDGLDINDSNGPFTVEDMVFKPGEKKPQWADNADADGQLLVEEAHYTNPFFEGMRIRIEPQEEMDDALELLGELTDKLQKAERMAAAGGIPLVWTPAGSSKSWTWYVLLGEYLEIPTTPTGESAGWFVSAPLVVCKLTCRPFGRGEEVRVLAPVTSSAPLQVVTLDDPGGDVPAEARVKLTDKAGQDRRHGELGLEQLDDAESPPALTLDSDSLSVAGLAGAQATREGAYDPNGAGNNVIRGPALTAPVAICSTGAIVNIGSFRLKPRIYALSMNLRVRASYKVGDGPWRALEWKAPVLINAFSEIDLGEVTLDRLAKGEQKSEIRIEQKSVGAKTESDLDYLNLIPTTKGYGKARGLAADDLTSLLAYDEFEQSAGNLTGGYTTNAITAITAANPGVITCTAHGLSNGDRVWIEGIVGTMGEVLKGFFTVAGVTTNTFNIGVNTTGKGYTSGGKVSKGGKTLPYPVVKWFGVGDPGDASINATAHRMERTEVSDASLDSGGRFFLIDSAPVAGVKAQANFGGSNQPEMALNGSESVFKFRLGKVVRYTDAKNWLMAALTNPGSVGADSGDGSDTGPCMTLLLIKCVGGEVTILRRVSSGIIPSAVDGEATSSAALVTVAVSVDAGGVYQVWSETAGSPLVSPKITGQDDALRTGGALASGQVGDYDAWVSASACTRVIDDVNVLAAPVAGRVCFASQSAELTSTDDWLREDADGDDWGPPSMYRGDSFYLPPVGNTVAVNRLAVKLRRGDTDTEADSNVADPQELEVFATPRVLLPR